MVKPIKIMITGPGVLSVHSKDILRTGNGKRQMSAAKQLNQLKNKR